MCNRSVIPKIFLFSSIAALMVAYMLQYFLNMLPCKLCIYERVILYITTFIAAVCLFKEYRVLVPMMFFTYVIGAIISFYHVGLELHWFHDILGCTEQITNNLSMDVLKNKLLNPDSTPSCDRPTHIFGISLATWNLIYLLATLLYSGKIYFKR
ncbi:MAG: disulfide bond formation protein B [Wolbachia endosymbiont of Fragariocoptes setiger]|nr:disulfide bond formation protein B [Wolbachia endosymbiont of Fragariocoptes setiger]